MSEKATILTPDGTPVETPVTYLESEEAELLRQYQRWGEIHGLQASMTCARCQQPMEVYVQAEIGFFCQCRVLLWRAS